MSMTQELIVQGDRLTFDELGKRENRINSSTHAHAQAGVATELNRSTVKVAMKVSKAARKALGREEGGSDKLKMETPDIAKLQKRQ
jgi:hypothetical protein